MAPPRPTFQLQGTGNSTDSAAFTVFRGSKVGTSISVYANPRSRPPGSEHGKRRPQA